MVAPKWTDYIHRFWRVSDRLSVLQLQTNKSKQRKTGDERYSSVLIGNKLTIKRKEPVDHLVNIINVYAPTSEKVERNKEEVIYIYIYLMFYMGLYYYHNLIRYK